MAYKITACDFTCRIGGEYFDEQTFQVCDRKFNLIWNTFGIVNLCSDLINTRVSNCDCREFLTAIVCRVFPVGVIRFDDLIVVTFCSLFI